MNLLCSKTKIPEHLKPISKIPFCVYRKYRPEYFEALTLLNACAHIHDAKPEPGYWNCSPEEIADWILADSGHPEYREAFIKNEIDGKAIIFLEADKFPKINIKNFEIIKKLTSKIRRLYKLDEDDIKRSISLPIRKPRTLYLWYKAKRTGPTAYYMTPTKYFKIVHIIPEEQACGPSYYALLNHWNRIPSFMPWCPHIMIGNDRRVNPMTGTTQRQIYRVQEGPYVPRKDALSVYHFPCGYKFPLLKDSKPDIAVKTPSIQ